MPNNAHPRPAEDQWSLLSSHGFSERFAGTWVEGNDPESVAQQLGADLDSRLVCDLPTAMRWYDPYSPEEIIWAGPHAPGWLHIISLSGGPVAPFPISGNGRRLFYLEYDDGEGGVHGLSYWRDGQNRGQCGRDSNFLGELEPLLGEYNLESPATVGFADEEDELNDYLHLIGLVTGRYIDHEWFGASRTLYRIPDEA